MWVTRLSRPWNASARVTAASLFSERTDTGRGSPSSQSTSDWFRGPWAPASSASVTSRSMSASSGSRPGCCAASMSGQMPSSSTSAPAASASRSSPSFTSPQSTSSLQSVLSRSTTTTSCSALTPARAAPSSARPPSAAPSRARPARARRPRRSPGPCCGSCPRSRSPARGSHRGRPRRARWRRRRRCCGCRSGRSPARRPPARRRGPPPAAARPSRRRTPSRRLALRPLAPVARKAEVHLLRGRRLHEPVAGCVVGARAHPLLHHPCEVVRRCVARQLPHLVEPGAYTIELLAHVIHVPEVRQGKPRGIPTVDEVERGLPLLEIDVGRRRRRQREVERRHPYAAHVPDVRVAAVLVQVDDVVRRVSGRVLDPQPLDGLAAVERHDVLLRHGGDLPPQPLHVVAVQLRCALQQLGRVDQVRRAALVHVHLELWEAAHEDAG